jgi:DNA-binding NarL/FixJ family response regulator
LSSSGHVREGFHLYKPGTADSSTLTSREIECLQAAADGQRYAAIADGLGLRPGYVKKVMSTAAQKLGAECAIQAVAIAFRRGLIK